jgi:hypothetical protein
MPAWRISEMCQIEFQKAERESGMRKTKFDRKHGKAERNAERRTPLVHIPNKVIRLTFSIMYFAYSNFPPSTLFINHQSSSFPYAQSPVCQNSLCN